MERKIGEIFEYNGEWYQCVIGRRCKDCAFNEERKCYTFTDNNDPIGDCSAERRTDKHSVVFKKLEKIGEPYKLGEVLIQQYQGIAPVVLPEDSECSSIFRVISSINVIEIEIKQTKEDMEENNDGNTPLNELTDRYVNGNINYDEFEKEVKALYSCKKEDMEEKKIQHYDCFFDEKPSTSNLKPFDLNAAKAGKPVCTRDGRKARIICFDRKSETPITALVTEIDGMESVYSYPNNGIWDSPENTNGCDLMMLTERKEGWVNVYKEIEGEYYTDKIIHKTEKVALDAACLNSYNYIGTVKINWEE